MLKEADVHNAVFGVCLLVFIVGCFNVDVPRSGGNYGVDVAPPRIAQVQTVVYVTVSPRFINRLTVVGCETYIVKVGRVWVTEYIPIYGLDSNVSVVMVTVTVTTTIR